jgi:hypothetical protein
LRTHHDHHRKGESESMSYGKDIKEYPANIWGNHVLGVEIENIALTIQRLNHNNMMIEGQCEKLLKIASELK